MFKATQNALRLVPEFDEWIDPNQKSKANWPDFHAALLHSHRPQALSSVSLSDPSRERLAYDELFAHQLTLALARAKENRKRGRVSTGDGVLQKRVLAALPYTADCCPNPFHPRNK